jgi:hypothetical protein
MERSGTVRPVSSPAKQSNQTRSVEQIESDIALKRARLATNLEALSYDTQPKVLAEKSKAKGKALVDTTKAKAKERAQTGVVAVKESVVGSEQKGPSVPPEVTGAVAGLLVGLVVIKVMGRRKN